MNKQEKGFWHHLGAEVGGPLYMGLYRYLSEKKETKDKKIYFLSESGYNLYHIFKRLGFENVEYLYTSEQALTAAEKENALKYLNKAGFFEQDVLCFECGWEGTTQRLLEELKKSIGYQTKQFFIYLGIKNTEKSREQVRGLHYDTFLFDFYKNYTLHEDAEAYQKIYELFFSAPHDCVTGYDEEGNPILKSENIDKNKEELLDGIWEYFQENLASASKAEESMNPEKAIEQLSRLIHLPTEEETSILGISQKEAKELPMYHLEDGKIIRSYYRWLKAQKKDDQLITEWNYRPKFSVVIPVYNTVTEQLEECIQSVLGQTYDNFELILVDDHSSWENVVPILKKYESDEKVQVIYRTENGHISRATNDGIRIASGDYIVFMDCDDTIEPIAFYEFAKKLNENPELDFIYSDEDKITEDGKIKHMPFFKPEWSPDLYLNMNYTNHLSMYRASIVKEVGGLRSEYNGSQDYDFSLRFMEKSSHKRVGHIPKILYHWRERRESAAFSASSKNYAADAARRAKEDYIRRNNLSAHLEYVTGMSQYRIVYEVVGNPMVSIIIPSKDHPEILMQCIDSVKEFTNYQNYEIIVVDNGSNDENKAIIESCLAARGAKYYYEKMDFNFSKMCNMGAACAKGEYLLFLNDDIEMFQPEWLERMLGQAQQKHIGAVGAKLFYPKTTKIQHAGVSNPAEGPTHSFWLYDDQQPYYFGWNRVDYDCIAVTGACLLVEKGKFQEIQGFDEKLAVAYNDVKVCLSLHTKGYYNVVRNDVAAYHHESLSRGFDYEDTKKFIRLNKERMELFKEFPDLNGKDPFMNENLHNYTDGLDLKHYYDKIEEIDLSDCEQTGIAVIDQVSVSDRILITGWSVLEGEEQIEKLERYIVYKDPYDKTYASRALPVSRPDVAAHLEQENYRYAGFECVLKKSHLRLDIMPYQIGILTIDRTGRKLLSWCQESKVNRNPKHQPFAMEKKKLDSYEKQDAPFDARWSVDECQHYDSYHRIRGFVFKPGNDHHHYAASLLLLDTNGEAFEFEIQLEERIDVAYTFPNEHFLYYTGFVSYLFDSVLEEGHEYDVIIRLRNQLKDDEIKDIATGQKVRL